MALTQPSDAASLAARFLRPNSAFGPVPIWWWSGAPLRNDRLRWQMQRLLDGGVDQAVIMCLAPSGPLYGSLADDPAFLSEAWWAVFLQACEDANDLGFRFWLYDQYGFSGANLQGQLVTANSLWAGQELVRTEHQVTAAESLRWTFPAASVPVAAYFVAAGGAVPQSLLVAPDATVTLTAGEPGRVFLYHSQARGFDYYDRAACAALIDTVLGEFKRRAGSWFGSVITGLFQDELPHMPTWGKDFAASFAAAYGYELLPRLADLWEGDGDDAARVRRDYHALRASLAREAFFEPYGEWAADAGLITGFDQQTPAREGDPAGATRLYGDYLGTHSVYSAPGSDHWGDSKLHSSLAHANGHPRTWLEAFHSSGWGGTLEETYDWLGPFLRRGANLYDPHAVYYSTAGGWWEWAPPSTCWRQPYWPDYPVFAGAVTRLCTLVATGHLVADTVLLYPTSSVQADLRLSGDRDHDARRTSDIYHLLNGATSWLDQRPGILDRAHEDYEIFDEQALRSGTVAAATWHIGDGSFHNLVLPAVSTLDGEVAARVAEFAAAGGRVIAVGCLPERFTGDQAEAGKALLDVADTVHVVATAEDVPDQLLHGPVRVDSDTPYMLRNCDGALVLLLVAHDDRTGTQMPVVAESSLAARVAGAFEWKAYWEAARREGYGFRPLGDRSAHVRVHGVADCAAQRWDPRSGDRVALAAQAVGADAVEFDVPFVDGPVAVVVLAGDLPEPTRVDPTGVPDLRDLNDDWEIEAFSTADNRWGDLGDPADRGVLPIQVWQLEHRRSENQQPEASADWRPALATFGPYLRVTAPRTVPGSTARDDLDWQPYELSLSRGIRKDPLHFENLGPKGTVPEEFLRWPQVPPGAWVGVAAAVTLPAGSGRHLVVGAPGERQVLLNGSPVPADGGGYWSTCPVADGPGRLEIELWLRAAEPRHDVVPTAPPDLRATFAVVTNLTRCARPEWLETTGDPTPGRVRFASRILLERVPDDARIQVGSEGPCSILVNGAEIGRQGAFEPYQAQRRPQVMPYDLASALRPGANDVVVQVDDLGEGVTALVDSIAVADGGLGLASDLTWTADRDGSPVGVGLRRQQWTDPRWVCLWPRPHPLPRAAWLDPATAGGGVVLDLVPDAREDGRRTECLRFTGPAGTTSILVPAAAPFTALVGGRELAPRDGRLTFDSPLPVGTEVCLRFTAEHGHREGGLLTGPIEASVAPVRAALADWRGFGLANLAGEVHYRQTVFVAAEELDSTVVLDLGEVRGTAEVRVGGKRITSLIWSPYRVDLTAHLRAGDNELEIVVRGTLAGYLDDASPTPAVQRGQTRHGLYGPVRLMLHRTPGRGGPMRVAATSRVPAEEGP